MSLACPWAIPHCAVSSPDGLRTTSHDDATFIVGCVSWLVVLTVKVITLGRFQKEDIQVQSPIGFEMRWAITSGLRSQFLLKDGLRTREVALAEHDPFLNRWWLDGLAHRSQNSYCRRDHLYDRKHCDAEAPVAFPYSQPLVTWCLCCPPDEIRSTTKWDHVIAISPRRCCRVDLGDRIKSRAVLWEWIDGLHRIIVQPFGAVGGGDIWDCPGVGPYLFNVLSAALHQSVVDSNDGFCHSRQLVMPIPYSERTVSLYGNLVFSSIFPIIHTKKAATLSQLI